MVVSSGTNLDTLLVGVDAGCRAVFDQLDEADAVPTLASLLDGGASADLTSQIPPWTPSAWPSLYTGVNPGRHGAFGFLSFDGYDWDVVDADDVREPSLWELLDHHDRTSVVVNVPVTHPPPEIDGAVVPGYTAPPDPTCHPAGVLDELREELDAGDYRVYAPPEIDSEAEDVAWYRRLTRMRGEAFRHLADRFDPDFGFVQFQQTDTVFHEYPGDFEKAGAVYEAVDEQVAAILDECDPDTVILASDHGIGPYEGYEFRVNEFLRRRGYARTAKGGEGMPSWDAVATRRLEGKGEEDGPSPAERAVELAARAGITSQRIGAALEAVGLADFVVRHAPSGVVRAGSERVDFPASTAYVRSRIELGVRINLAGREPEGVVPPEEYESVRSDLVAALSAVETPDGEPVFETVVPREDVFDGPYVEDAPDVITVPTSFDHFLSAQLRGEEFGPPREPWNHKREGIVAVAGEGVDADADLSDAHLFDVAPTVMAALGLPTSDRMDGTALSAVAATEERTYPTLDDGDRGARPRAGDAGTDEEVERRLADMGYLERT